MDKFCIFAFLLVSVHALNQTNSTDTNMPRNFQGVDSSKFLNPDEQCKMLLGRDASFCRAFKDQMCTNLFCRKSLKEPCIEMPDGVQEGTTCDSGKICLQKSCTENTQAMVGECLFGDDVVTQESIGMKLPLTQMECKDVLYHINQIGQAPTAYCSNSNFRQICCETCQKYDILSCADRYFDCPRYKDVCDSGTINGLPVTILCPRTCGKCDSTPVSCPENRAICKNGGKCVNIKVSNQSLFGFTCECPEGYKGELCENRDSCIPNPCNPNEKCIQLGNIAYKCVSNSSTETSKIYSRITTVSRPKTTPTSTTTTTRPKLKMVNNAAVVNGDCENYNDDICNYYAQQNLCGEEYFLNGKPITKRCKKACKLC
ncbi:unnamed protein product [Brachionus calyciflorus]|uniref:Uncharacterized protein n=1 Tax=Brachionus calyciflorus TaxID=104777 RepID=A0A813R0W3_9BILA|nr:unnamed protein product [Brachionus calyciflorus]